MDSAREFEQQLRDVKDHASEVSREYTDLSPEGRRACREHLDQTAKTLQKIQRELEEADKADLDPDARVVQVLGVGGRVVWSSDFRRSFESLPAKHIIDHSNESFLKWIPAPFELETEYNYALDKNLKLKPAEEQHFITFNNVKDARHALGLKDCVLTLKEIKMIPVTFVKPAQNSATRETFRKIGGLVDRVKEIEKELKTLGAVRDHGYGRPMPSPTYLDKAYFVEMLPQWKRARSAGQALDHNACGVLKCRRPVDTKSLQARLDALYNEECDALIQLREYQTIGIEFDF